MAASAAIARNAATRIVPLAKACESWKRSAPREINYLRLSITDRCQLRCFYCTYWQDWEKLPTREILSYEELLRLAGIAARLGIRKVRVTGGEPLVRRGVVGFLHSLHQVPGIEEVCLTTNGVLLADLAPALYDTGLRHLNLSLDTLRRERYREITGQDNLGEVLAGLERAVTLGFRPLKINCVVMAGINDDELVDLALLARDHPYQVRFIELMPTVSPRQWQQHFLPMAEVRRRLAVLGPMDRGGPPDHGRPGPDLSVTRDFRANWDLSPPSVPITAAPAIASVLPRPAPCGPVSLATPNLM